MRIAVCIEENPADDLFAAFMLKLCVKIMSEIKVCRFQSKNEFLHILQKESFDLAYLNLTGGIKEVCGTLIRLREADKRIPVFLATEYWKYLEKLFDIGPTVFIRKPLEKRVFRRIFAGKKPENPTEDYFFEYFFRRKIYRIQIGEILYFESSGRNIVIHLNEGRHERFIGHLDEVEKRLFRDGQSFVRSHQSYLIRRMAIRRYDDGELCLKNNEILPISQNRKNDFLVEMKKEVQQKS